MYAHTEAVATVVCPGCHQPRDVSVRQSRRVGLCRRCLRPPRKIQVTDSDRRFWLSRFSDSDLAQIAAAFFDTIVPEQTFTSRRVALTGSAAYDPTRD